VPFILALRALGASIVQAFLSIIRDALLIVLIGGLPLAAAASISPSGRQTWHKMIGWLIAFILFKPVAAMCYAGALWSVTNASNEIDQIAGIFLVILAAVLTLPALKRLIGPQVEKGGGGGAMLGGREQPPGRCPWPACPAAAVVVAGLVAVVANKAAFLSPRAPPVVGCGPAGRRPVGCGACPRPAAPPVRRAVGGARWCGCGRKAGAGASAGGASGGAAAAGSPYAAGLKAAKATHSTAQCGQWCRRRGILMSSSTETGRTYGNWRKPRSVGMFGQSALFTYTGHRRALIVALLTLMFAGPYIGAAVAGVAMLTLAPLLVRMGGRTLYQAVALRWQWSRQKRRHADLYRSGPLLATPNGTHRPAAYTVVLRVNPRGAALVGQDQVDAWVAGWGRWLGQLGETGDIVGCAVVIETALDPGNACTPRSSTCCGGRAGVRERSPAADPETFPTGVDAD